MADQELFDGEVKTTIEDDENIAFRKANPADPGSRVISWANFKTILTSAFVALTGNQVIDGIKQFILSPTVPDPTTDLQAVNLRTLNTKTADPDYIDFVPQDPVPSYLLGRMFYDTVENTWTFYNDIEGISLQLGEELRARLTNDTGDTLLNGAAVAVTGSVGINLKVELLDASNLDSSIRGFGLITIETLDGNPGYAVRYGAVRELDTSLFAEDDIIYGDPDVPGGLTNVRPEAPNYPVRIGVVIISDATNGVIGVDTLAFNGTDTTVNIDGLINGIVTQTPNISYDASSGDIIATVTNEAFPTKKLPFLIDGVRYLLDTITSPQTIIIPPGLSASETEESILYIKLNAGVPELAVTTSSTISEPFAILSIQTVFNATRTDSDGKPLSYRRYNDAMNSLAEGVDGAYGLLNVIMNWLRLRGGAGWTSGQDATPVVDNANIKIPMTAGVGGQVHRANLPLFDGDSYLIYNDNTNSITYAPSTNLTDITETSAGVTLLANNVYYPLKIYYLLNSNGVGNDVIATRPSGFYTTSDEAKSDALKYGTSLADPKTELNSYGVYTMIIGRTGGAGATISLIELQNDRKRTLKSDGGGGGASTPGGTDDKVRVSAADTVNNYLDSKVSAGSLLTKTILTPGADEKLEFDFGGTATKDTELDGTNLLDLIIGGWNDPPKAWQNIVIYSKDYFYASANNNGAYFELSQTGGGASSQANMFSEGNAAIQADGVLTLDSPESEFKGQAHAYNGASVIKATTSTPTFDFSLGNDHQMDVESNVSAFATTGEVGSGNYKVWLINDATPGRTVAAPIGDGPTAWTKATTSQDHDTSANAVNLYQFYTRPDGTKYYNINVQ